MAAVVQKDEPRCTGWPVPDRMQDSKLVQWCAELADMLAKENLTDLQAQVIWLETDNGYKQGLGVVGALPTARFEEFIDKLGGFSVAHDRVVSKPFYINKRDVETFVCYLP